MSIVTKMGDKGTTRTLANEELSKADSRIEVTGAVDELNAQVGFARSLIAERGLNDLADELRTLQLILFRLGAESSAGSGNVAGDPIAVQDVAAIEELISAHESAIKLPRSLLVPGTTPPAAALEVARVTARKLERRMVDAKEKNLFANADALRWLNRASDYLFIIARSTEKRLGVNHDET